MEPLFTPITSASNPRIKRLRTLQTKARARREEQAFILEGSRLFRDAPAEALREIYLTRSFCDRADAAERSRLERFAAEGRAFLLPESLMEKVSETETPQGILCVAAMPAADETPLTGAGGKDGAPLILLLEDLQDPGNLGTIFRTAEAAGATCICMSSGCADVFSPKTVRATMSSIFRVPFRITADLPGLTRELGAGGILTCAAHLEGSREYDRPDYTRGTAFLIGNEGRGLTAEAAEAALERVRIPMQGRIESLNAAMAAGILLYEAARQRRNAPEGTAVALP